MACCILSKWGIMGLERILRTYKNNPRNVMECPGRSRQVSKRIDQLGDAGGTRLQLFIVFSSDRQDDNKGQRADANDSERLCACRSDW